MCNPFTSLTCNTNIGEWIFQGLLGWSIGFTTLFCFGSLWLAVLLVGAWGRLAGYTKPVAEPQTEAEHKQNQLAGQGNTLFWMMKIATVVGGLLALLAWGIGQIFNP